VIRTERLAANLLGYKCSGQYRVANAAMTDDTTSKTPCASDTVIGANESRDAKSLRVAIYFLSPFVVFVLTYVLAPGYITPFLNNPPARAIFFGLLVWHGFGTWVFTRTSKSIFASTDRHSFHGTAFADSIIRS
jgi:hypothetical protein